MKDFVLRIGGKGLAGGKKRVPKRQPGRALGERNHEGLCGTIEGLNVPFEEGLSAEQDVRKESDRAETQKQGKDPELFPPVRAAHRRRV